AEVARRQLLELDPLPVDVGPEAVVVRGRLHAVGGLVLDDLGHAGSSDRAVHGVVDVARYDPALAVDLRVALVDAVTGDAGDALARDRGAVPEREVAALAERGAHRGVAAQAEVVDGALREIVDLLLELVEHRRDRGIGVVRAAPLLVDLRVAGRAL